MDNSTERKGKDGNATNPDSHRGCEMDEHLESEQPNGAEPFGNGRERNATTAGNNAKDTLRDGCQRRHSQIEEHQRNIGNIGAGDIQRICRESERFEGADIAGLGRWSFFPTVSPIHRGNDGLPFPLDDLTISSGKWRTESLKAYGNAIVPQVMYEIFRAIEIVEQTFKPKQP